METLSLISSKSALTLTSSPNPRLIPTKQCFGLPLLHKNPNGSLFVSKPRSKTVLCSFTARNSRRKASHNHINGNRNANDNAKNVGGVELFASTSRAQETTSVGVNPQPYVPPPSTQFGSPLFWIGVGVGFSALFSFGASYLKKYAMQQAFKTMMGQMGSQNNQFSNSAFPSGSPFGFPPPSSSGPTTFPGYPYQPPSTAPPSTSGLGTSSTAPSAAQPQATPPLPAASVTMDVSANTPGVTEPVVNDEAETKIEAKQSAFADISPEETLLTSPFENYDDTSSWGSSEAKKFADVETPNGAVSKERTSSEWSQGTRKTGSPLSVETLEKMFEDPNIQKMIFPHLPAEMRDPATIKWMLQNPLYRQQLQEVIDNMGGGNLEAFDLMNNPEKIKEQFDQIGLTPEEAMSRIMANPEVARAFQNPRVMQAMMDCSQNPMNFIKYQNDKEVMDAFNKIQEIFPGSSGF